MAYSLVESPSLSCQTRCRFPAGSKAAAGKREKASGERETLVGSDQLPPSSSEQLTQISSTQEEPRQPCQATQSVSGSGPSASAGSTTVGLRTLTWTGSGVIEVAGVHAPVSASHRA